MSPRDYISGIGFPLLLCRFPYQGFPSSIGEKGNIVVVLLLITGILNTSIPTCDNILYTLMFL